MDQVQQFNAQKLEAACRVLGDTERGLTGSEIGYLLQECKLTDVTPGITKWQRLFNALAEAQNKYQVGNHLIMLINRALDPVKYIRDKEKFEWRRSEINVVLAFSGFMVRDDGKVIISNKETTLKGARARAGALRSKLEDRNSHLEIFNYCQAELLEENYFHAVLEAIKGVADRTRKMSGLKSDGAELVNKAFSVKAPILAINSLSTETELSEQKGFGNMLIGIFGAIRNPTAHAPKITWPISEQDALDIFSMISFIHRKLDITIKIGGS
ncbi:MAG: TIGR02391 family protein [Desulfobacula sp.]|uniref:TIGR02391 family protein n=1 Tax=Desulfobacula sp. TaxID=2593537 RepID=UPI0025BB5D46|nr:TIGR02391 family protein [Desulfobacula sp.]MCD4721817.1 TIGR02391 family protein [Desulfobacula sp.]